MQLRIGGLYLDGNGSEVAIVDIYQYNSLMYVGCYISGVDVEGHNYTITPHDSSWVFNEDGTLGGVYDTDFNLISEVEVKPRIYKRSR